jgi:hypothetical protein
VAEIDPSLRHNLNNLLARMLAAAETGLYSPMDRDVRAEFQTIVDLVEDLAEALRPPPQPHARHE